MQPGRRTTDPPPDQSAQPPRRHVLHAAMRSSALASLAVLGGFMLGRSAEEELVWQIDPSKCNSCGRCADHCVIKPSAVRCVHAYARCGYCRLCTGYFVPDAPQLVEAAENAQCPTDAIVRTFVEDPYYEYTIDESRCVGCARCVDGCTQFGNGSLYLQVRHDRCLNCNQCAIARVCPQDAFVRIPASQAYLLKDAPDLPDHRPPSSPQATEESA
jgi:electron transport complex protein RnfB